MKRNLWILGLVICAVIAGASYTLFRSIGGGVPKPAILRNLSDQAAWLVVVTATANCKVSGTEKMKLDWKAKELPPDPEAVDKAMAFLRDQQRRYGDLPKMCDGLYLEGVIGRPFS